MGTSGHGMRAARWGAGTLVVLAALAGCSSGDGKPSAHAGASSAAAEATKGPGDYRPPTALCPKIDFGPLTAAVAPTAGAPKGQLTGSDPSTAAGAACLQAFRTTGTKADGRSTVYCTAWKDVPTAIKQYAYRLSSAPKEAQGAVVKESGLGGEAFRYGDAVDAGAALPGTGRTVTVPSALCSAFNRPMRAISRAVVSMAFGVTSPSPRSRFTTAAGNPWSSTRIPPDL
ncbi:hypothetical protein [Streptomyces griseorubiginosus]|uniref:hypothetical protein n=1 Tax=Streptomyces griseorubiginosus TaxID=67304 RepID=UPI0036A49DE1